MANGTCLAILLFLCSIFVEGLNYYELLQVGSGASPSEIRKAYRRIALKYHPDKGRASENAMRTEFMKEVNSARDTLSDLRERAAYDMHLGPWYFNPGGSIFQGDPFQNWLTSRRQADQRQRQHEEQQRQATERRRRESENRQRQDAERRRQEMERNRRQEEARQRQAEERRRSEFIERQRQEAEHRRQAEEAKKQHAKQIEREMERMRKEAQQRKEEAKKYAEQIRKETERMRKEAEERRNEAEERRREAEQLRRQAEYEYNLRQAEARRAELERKNKRNFITAVSTGAAGTAAAVVGGILYFRHRASEKRCNTCMKTNAAGAEPVSDACSNSISDCKSYYFKLADHCGEKCSTQQIMQPMNLYLHKILQNQSEPMFQLIQNATSIEDLRPAVTFFHQLKDMELKTHSNSRFRESLSAKVEQAIIAKEDMINGVVLPPMAVRIIVKCLLFLLDISAAANTT